MCGISGFFINYKLNKDATYEQIISMNNSINHRGPDSEGYWIDHKKGIALGHKRLSIIDLSNAGCQPMSSNKGRYIISFNGEIYNHKLLRKQLSNSGHNIIWKGHSDTETLVNAIEIWGIKKTLKEIIGMYAFAIFDQQSDTLIICRDRMGEKPLYYGLDKNHFIFGSELKTLLKFKDFKKEIDMQSFNLFLNYGYIPSPKSIFQGIKKLKQGSFLKIKIKDSNIFELKEENYWNLENIVEIGKSNQYKGSFQDASKDLEEMLENTIKEQMIADVDLGAFLSGGIDSSLISTLMQKNRTTKIKTFSIGFENKKYDEAVYAKNVSKIIGSDHTELYVSENDALEIIPTLQDIYDEPFADSSQIPTILLAKLTRNHVKVALSGDGGDETFGGYNRYLWFKKILNYSNWINQDLRRFSVKQLSFLESKNASLFLDFFESIIFKKGINNISNKVNKLLKILEYSESSDLYQRIISIIYDLNSYTINNSKQYHLDYEFFKKDLKGLSNLMSFDSITYLPDDILVKVDRASMRFGLETRIPFLDKRIVEFAWTLPLEMKIKKNNKKRILKKILSRYLPKDIIERPKQGFGVPIGEWLKGPLKPWADDLLSKSEIEKNPYLNSQSIREKWNEHISGKCNNQYLLWNFLIMQSWLKKNQ